MLGGYIGQFLPLSGGTLGGTLNLGGHDLNYLGNLNDNAGNTRIQLLNAGSDRAMNFFDDLGNVVMVIDEYSVRIPGVCNLSPENGMSMDDSGNYFFGDGNGNLELDCTTLLVKPSTNGGSGTITGTVFSPTVALSGSAIGIGTVLGGSISGGSGKKYLASFRNASSDNSYVDANGNFIKASFIAAQAIYVDGTNGSDTKGNGSDIAPYATIAHALSTAASGQCVVVGPGTYTTAQIVIPAGVSLAGSGMDVTTLNSSETSGGPHVIVGTGTVVSDLSIFTQFGHNVPPIGFQAGAASGSTQTSTLFYLRRIRATADIDGLYIGNKTGFYSAVYFECRDCIFASNYDTFQIAGVDSTAWPISFDLINCQFLPTKISGGSGILRCITGGAQIVRGRLFNCLLTVTDVISTTVSALGSYDGISLNSSQAINLEMYGTTVNFNIPNVSASLITTSNYTAVSIGGVSSTLKIGAGNTFDPNSMGIAASGTVTFLPVPNGKSASALPVSSSAVLPYASANGNQFDIAADAGTLTSNTLTINNPSTTSGIGTAATTDGMETRYRIKNTNSGSTAMTLSLGSNFNVGSTTLSTIAAGKRAYLTFAYDADNSKWDLMGYVNGL
jgi:hypothetical protein